MAETPNLIYLEELSEGNLNLKTKLKTILKKEFESEMDLFYINLEKKDYQKMSENVHKLRHKIGFFGMKDAYQFSALFEENLRNNSTEYLKQFEECISTIKQYITKNNFI